jgi:hypothetical protein
MNKELVFCRVSSELQAEGGLSLVEQIQGLKSYALRNGVRIEELFLDRGCTFPDDCLPSLKDMVAWSPQAPEFAGIPIMSLCQLARCPYTCRQIIENIKKAGVRIVSNE